ncbi:MAG: isoprenylcysteine carboxylmethyltransferase family protein [Pyrinomonadaceae bacterium]
MLENLPVIVFGAVMVSWLVFAVAFFLNTRPASAVTPDRKRAPASIVGIVLQGLSYGLVWTVRRPLMTLPYRFSAIVAVIWAVLTITIAVASVWFTVAAVRTLGKEWSLTARVVEEHRLVQAGPYRLVRHPIYTGMLGMLLATGFALGNWWVLIIAVCVFLVGTRIRVGYEERLLREAFGAEFDDFARRVPAIIPFLI